MSQHIPEVVFIFAEVKRRYGGKAYELSGLWCSDEARTAMGIDIAHCLHRGDVQHIAPVVSVVPVRVDFNPPAWSTASSRETIPPG